MNKDELVKIYVDKSKAVDELAKQAYLNNLFAFNQDVLKVEEGGEGTGKRVPLREFQKELCRFIETNITRKKLALMPRGHLKTTLVTVGYSLQRIARDSKVRILIANATSSMAEAMLGQIKRHLQYNETFKYYFGDLSANTSMWRDNMITLPSGEGSYQSKEATVTAYGLGGNLVSQHYDLIIIDDAHNQDNINTKDQIDKVKQSYRNLLDLLEPGGQLIIVGTRWHDSDLYGMVMDKTDIQSREFDVFTRQAITDMKLGREEGGHYKIESGNVLWPEKYDLKHLTALLNEHGIYEFQCTPAETPILMADWTIKQVKDVQEGDMVLGWTNGIGHQKNHLCPTKVLHKMEREDVVNDFVMESGRKVRCTADHKWYSGKCRHDSHLMYRVIKAGMKLCFVVTPEVQDTKREAWNYLAGILDGEGSFKSGGGVTIAQSKTKNPDVYKKIIETLDYLKLDYKVYPRKAYGMHSESYMVSIRNSRSMIIHLLRTTDFGKRGQAINWLAKKCSRLVRERDKVLDIKIGKKEPVYALETETGNYIAWGYASSNCQYQNIVTDDENAVFHKQWFHEYDPTDLRDRKLTKFTAIDPAISLKERADFTAIVTIGVDVLGKIYILEVKRGHYTEDQMVDELFLTNEKFHPQTIQIETVAFQKTLQHYIMKEVKKRGRSLPLNEVMPETSESKEKRIRLLQPIYMRSDIYHSKTVADIEYLEDELLRFPKGKNDDLCLSGDTIIKVWGGDKKIKDVKVGDSVWTRKGYKKVLRSWCTGKKKVISKFGLKGTPDHPVITKNGTKSLIDVRVSDTIYIWNDRLSDIEEKNTIDTLGHLIDSSECTFGDMINNLNPHLPSTDKFGLTILEKYRLDLWFTTKMVTRSTMNQSTLYLCPNTTTPVCILLNQKEGKCPKNISRLPTLPQKFGTQAQRVGLGINSIPKNSGKIQRFILKSVYNVAKSILLLSKILGSVKNNIVELNGEKPIPVYNLTVEGTHEFIANGVLVHNCDCLAYAVRASFPPRQKDKSEDNRGFLY